MTNEKFSKLFGGPPRQSEARITKREMDIASSIQKVTEKIIFNMASYTKKINWCRKFMFIWWCSIKLCGNN